MLPGGTVGNFPPGAAPDPAAIDARLDAVEAAASQLGNAIYDAIDQRIAAQQAQADAIRDHIEGHLESRLAHHDFVASEVAAKVTKRIDQKIGNAYQYAWQFGAQYPTPEQMLAGLVTGNIGESMGSPLPVRVPPVPMPGIDPEPLPDPNPQPAGSGTVPPPIGVIPPPPPPVGSNGSDGTTGGGIGVGPPPPPPPPVYQPPPPPPPPPPVQSSTISGARDVQPVPGSQQCPPGYVPASTQYYQGAGDLVLPPPGDGPPGQYALNRRPLQGGGTAGVNPAWQLTGPINTTNAQFNALMQNCYRPARIRRLAGVNPDTTVTIQGDHVFPVQSWNPLLPPPPPPDAWDLVVVLPPVDETWPLYNGQAWAIVPAGFQLFTDRETGYTYAAPAIPDWGCRQGEIGRFHGGAVVPPPPPPPPGGVIPPPAGGPPPGCVPAPGLACPVLPPADCGAPPGGQLPQLQQAGDDFCSIIDQMLDQWTQAEIKLGDWIGMGMGPSATTDRASVIQRAILGNDAPVLPDLLNRFAKWLGKLIKEFAGGMNCDPLKLAPIVMFRGLAHLVDKYTGVVPDQLLATIDQVSHTVCHVILPGVAEADHAYMADAISQDVWECWVKAAGHHTTEAKTVRDANRHKPTQHIAAALLRRQYIDQDRYDRLVRQNGVTDDQDKQDLWNWGLHWPSVGDATRWAGEQLFDDAMIDRFKLNDGFDDLWQTRFKDLVDGFGMDKEWAQKHWQAHWRRPGVGELIEMVRRLRPDVVAADVAFTPDDLDAALKQEGYNDYWAKRVKAVAYRVAQRRDVQRLWDYHLIEEEEMHQILQDQGYASDFADQLVASWKIQRKQTELRYNGAPMGGSMVRDFARGVLSSSELQEQATQISYYDGQADEIIDNANNARALEERRMAVAGLKREFMLGLVSLESAEAALAGKGMDTEAVNEITQYWVRIKNSKPKQIPAATLCTWRQDGLINAAEQLTALTRLGYTSADAGLIVKDCTLKIERAQQKAEEKAAAQAAKSAQAAEKAAEKAAKNATLRRRVITPPARPGAANGAAGH